MSARVPAPASRTDVLRWPLVGPFLRWRHARTSMQLVLLAVAAVVTWHGLVGPSLAPRNLATVLTWVHYRGLLVVALLAAGNLFCTGCPFVLVRDAGRRLHRPTRRWPVRLRGKWIAMGLLAAVLLVYEWLDLWAWPQGTAWLLVAYFVAALAIDLTFSGATFCKHLCPIGQFNFVASTLSPLEVRVKDIAGCGDCKTHDCIRGRREPEPPRRTVQRGCELGLFLPAKVGNLDCTFCLDCVQACPHDNVVLSTRVPGAELIENARRSGIGRLSQRRDLAAFVAVFAFAALLNAFAMTSPVYSLAQWLGGVMGTGTELPVLAVLFVAGLVVLPFATVMAAAGVTRGLAPSRKRWTAIATSYAYALVPIGFAVWVAHYGFHLLTGALTVVPVLQSAAVDALGHAALGAPLWSWAGMRPGAVYPLEVGCLLLGAAGSLAVAWGISRRDYPGQAARAAASWTVLVLLMAAAGLWVLSQPMEMRGTLL
jgi:polyferredoxin